MKAGRETMRTGMRAGEWHFMVRDHCGGRVNEWRLCLFED